MARWEKIDNEKIKLTVEVPVEEFEEGLQKAYQKIVKQVVVPGFRKGKVPRKIMEARLGPEVLYEEALEHVFPGAYQKALEEEQLELISEPEFNIEQLEKGKPVIFTVVAEAKPPVTLGDYKGLEIEVTKEKVTDKKVDEYIDAVRQRSARLVEVEDKGAEEGNVVLLDFTGYVDGEVFEGGEATDYSLELGSGTFIKGFEEQLLGAKPGDELEIKVTFPDDYRSEQLKGKEAVFKVNIKEIKEKQLPELNDDLAREVSDFDSFAEYRESIRNNLEMAYDNNAKNNIDQKVIDKIAGLSQVDENETLIEKQLNNMMSDMEQYLRQQGTNLESYMQQTGLTLEDIKKEQREEAFKRVKVNMILDAIAKKEGLAAEEREVDEAIAKVAEQNNDTPERIKELFDKQGRLNMIKEEIKIRKVVDFLVENAIVTITEHDENAGDDTGGAAEKEDFKQEREPAAEQEPESAAEQKAEQGTEQELEPETGPEAE